VKRQTTLPSLIPQPSHVSRFKFHVYRLTFDVSLTEKIMFENYLKIALRNIRKHKVYSFLNIAGLAIGLSSSILIMIFVLYERSYDRYHKKTGQIYRIAVRAMIGDTRIAQIYTPAVLTPTLLQDYPEVLHSVRFQNYSRGILVRTDDRVFNEYRVTSSDAAVFEVFTFPFIKGDSSTALAEPNTCVITETTAKKYFAEQDPMDRVLTIGDRDFRITGIIEDIAENSHFHFDIFSSIVTYEDINSKAWGANNYKTYILLQEDCTKKIFESKLSEIVKRYVYRNREDEWAKDGDYWEYFLQPLTEIHLTSDLHGEFEANGNAAYVSIFSIIAVFILLIASFNYMNLSTAKSASRAREVGIRKVIGSTRAPLMWQFLVESCLSSVFALILALIAVELILPSFCRLVGKQQLGIPYFKNLWIVPGLMGLALFIGVLSGSYPALFLSSFKPISILRGKLWSSAKNTWLRNGLVLIQFSISIILFIGTLAIQHQLKYLQNRRLGFDKEHVVVIKTPQSLGQRSQAFKQILIEYPNIISASGSSTVPGRGYNNIGFIPEREQQSITLNLTCCDFDFLETLRLEMTNGRFFSRVFPTDSLGIVINETTVELLGWENPLRMHFYSGSRKLRVIGVVKDFHYESLHHRVRPGALLLLPGIYRWSENYISVRIQPEDIPKTIDMIRKTWDDFTAGMPFEYSFLDEDYDTLYHNEQRTGKVFTIFSLLAIFIACLGLFGLSSFAAEQKTKEIGIRKVFGASVPGIVFLLSWEFTKWVIIANVFAWPISFHVMSKWLQNFAYRINVGFWSFVISGLLALMIALITVSIQSVKAAMSNPIKSIRYE
jgi:putative ABC transport system permease protein